jgi:hypothetical protein
MYLGLFRHHFRVLQELVQLEMNETEMSGHVLRLGGRELALSARQRRPPSVDDRQKLRVEVTTDVLARHHRRAADDAGIADRDALRLVGESVALLFQKIFVLWKRFNGFI